ncbi:hypothetical protein V6N12_023792 [Hibiscus sabdariffa]|uniref:Uncharacterized protein n=1 Tax=Hibiscus sabdariffa TaxID=183260 RepID=A0ABR2FZD9_9ROSI
MEWACRRRYLRLLTILAGVEDYCNLVMRRRLTPQAVASGGARLLCSASPRPSDALAPSLRSPHASGALFNTKRTTGTDTQG